MRMQGVLQCRLMVDNKWGDVPEQARALAELEQSIGEEIPLVRRATRNGVFVEDKQITSLEIVSPKLTVFPEGILILHSLKRLFLRGKVWIRKRCYGEGVRKVPAGIGELPFLESLSLEENGLRTLPRSVGRLQQLQRLELEGSEFRVVPRCISTLYALRRLDLEDNHIQSIPNFVFKLPRLQRLLIEKNPLDSRSVVLLNKNKWLWFDHEVHYDGDESTYGTYEE